MLSRWCGESRLVSELGPSLARLLSGVGLQEARGLNKACDMLGRRKSTGSQERLRQATRRIFQDACRGCMCANMDTRQQTSMQAGHPLFLYLVRVEDVEDELHLVRAKGGGSMGSMSVSLAAEAFLTHVRSGQCGQETCLEQARP